MAGLAGRPPVAVVDMVSGRFFPPGFIQKLLRDLAQ
jgi:hypothetical protein